MNIQDEHTYVNDGYIHPTQRNNDTNQSINQRDMHAILVDPSIDRPATHQLYSCKMLLNSLWYISFLEEVLYTS